MSATTAGRRLERILLIAEVSLYLQYTSARIDTRIQEGKIEPKVAAIAPGIPAICRPVNVGRIDTDWTRRHFCDCDKIREFVHGKPSMSFYNLALNQWNGSVPTADTKSPICTKLRNNCI